jgi:hypothetical protein
VPGKIYVPGDAAATAANILAQRALFQAEIAVGIVAELAVVGAVLALDRLLRGVDRDLAAVMVILILIDVPLAFLGVANEVATLALLTDPGFLSVFEEPQREALALRLVQFDRKGVLVSQIFWGLWLLPLGLLVYRSRFLPHFLGVWLLVNGLAYLALSAIGIALGRQLETALAAATPLLLGELALTLWLLAVGVRGQPAEVAAARAEPDR